MLCIMCIGRVNGRMAMRHLLVLSLLFMRKTEGRTCQAGYVEREGGLCCEPAYCPKDTYITDCTSPGTTEVCTSCPEGETLVYGSSSYNKKACYKKPSCLAGRPEIVALNSSHCECNRTGPQGQYNHPPESKPPGNGPVIDCQPMNKSCGKGEEPVDDYHTCRPCQKGTYKSTDDDPYGLCRDWRNCTLLGYKTDVPGSTTKQPVCGGPLEIQTRPAETAVALTSTPTPRNVQTTEEVSPPVAETVGGTEEVVEEAANNINLNGIIIGVVLVVVLALGVAVGLVCYLRRRKRQRDSTYGVENPDPQEMTVLRNGSARQSPSVDSGQPETGTGDFMDTLPNGSAHMNGDLHTCSTTNGSVPSAVRRPADKIAENHTVRRPMDEAAGNHTVMRPIDENDAMRRSTDEAAGIDSVRRPMDEAAVRRPADEENEERRDGMRNDSVCSRPRQPPHMSAGASSDSGYQGESALTYPKEFPSPDPLASEQTPVKSSEGAVDSDQTVKKMVEGDNNSDETGRKQLCDDKKMTVNIPPPRPWAERQHSSPLPVSPITPGSKPYSVVKPVQTSNVPCKHGNQADERASENDERSSFLTREEHPNQGMPEPDSRGGSSNPSSDPGTC